MVIDPANLTNTHNQTAPEREINPAVQVDNVNNEGLSGAGRTSEIGPAVVNNISAATLETSRAVSAPEQTAESGANHDIVEARRRDQLPSVASAPGEPSRESQIDKTV